MKNIERGTIKHLIILILAILVCGMILYPLFDLVLCKFFTNSEFTYSFESYIIKPAISAIIIGTILWSVDKKMVEK